MQGYRLIDITDMNRSPGHGVFLAVRVRFLKDRQQIAGFSRALLNDLALKERPTGLLAAVDNFAGDDSGHGSAFEGASVERRIARFAW
jgi:hypothetical protein